MFEKFWKPHFDNWTEKTNDYLEGVLQNPEVLQQLSIVLENAFKGKMMLDKGIYLLHSRFGNSTYRDQKKILHLLLKVQAQVEDLSMQIDDLRDELNEKQELSSPSDWEHIKKKLEAIQHKLPELADEQSVAVTKS